MKKRMPTKCSCRRVLTEGQCYWCDKPVANLTLDHMGFYKTRW